MPTENIPAAIVAADVPVRARPSVYPEPFASRMAGRAKRQLGEVFRLSNFGVNLTTLVPGGSSALRHAHTRQDEFVYVLSGTATLHTDAGLVQLTPGDEADYPDDDIKAALVDGKWAFTHKNGDAY